MEPDEIRAEVERRKQLARDLKIREVLWDLEKHFRNYRAWLRDDPQFAVRLIYPGVVVSDDEVRFSIEQATFQLTYVEGPVSHDESWSDSRGNHSEWDTSRGTLTLKVNAENVFKFDARKTTEWNQFGPVYYDDDLGEIARFIEGPWVTEIADFARKVKAHSVQAWKERNAPRETREAEELRKRFGF